MSYCNLLSYICEDLPPNVQLYKRVISVVNGLSKSTNLITSLCYRLVVNGSAYSVTNTISIIISISCVNGSDVCTINKTRLILHVLMTV